MGEEEETSQHLTSPASFFFLPSIFASLFLHRGARISERVPKSAAVEGVVAAQQHEPTLPPLSSWNRALRRTRKQGTPDRATTVRAAAPAHCGMCSLHMPVSREREKRAKSLVPTTPTRLLLERFANGEAGRTVRMRDLGLRGWPDRQSTRCTLQTSTAALPTPSRACLLHELMR